MGYMKQIAIEVDRFRNETEENREKLARGLIKELDLEETDEIYHSIMSCLRASSDDGYDLGHMEHGF